MEAYTDSMKRLVEAFGRMPGIGQRTAERLTYYVLRSPKGEMEQLAQTIRDVKEKVGHCSQCHNITESDPCRICADTRRDASLVCVVEEAKDVFAFEATGSFRGLYHVLMGRIAPLDGVGPESLEIASLLERVKRGTIKEVIMATNPNLEGDGTALYLSRKLSELGVRVTRLARGLASGSVIEHANPAILSEALSERKEM
jgi:recombination protein RecR